MSGINDGNKVDQFDNEQAQLVHNDVAYQGATEATVSTLNNKIIQSTGDSSISQSLPIFRVLPYEPKTYSVTASNITLANQKSMIAIQNTGTSIIKIRKIYLTNTQSANNTGVIVNFRLQRIESFSGGTSLNPFPHNTLNGPVAGVTVATNATIVSESALFRDSFWSSDEWSVDKTDTESTDHTSQELIPWYFADHNEQPITLIQNQGLHVKCNTPTTAGTFTITIVYTSEVA